MRFGVTPASTVLAIFAVFLSQIAGAQEPAVGNAAASVRSVSGVLECRAIKDSAPCGHDTFTIIQQSDGTRTLRALSTSDQRGMQINIVLRVDAAFRPLDAFTQTYSEGKFLGAAFFAVAGDTMTVLTKTPERMVNETIAVPAKFSMLMHPVSADGWHYGHYDRAKGGRQLVPRCAVGGARESVRCAVSDTALEFVAQERITVPAGTFDTARYRFGESTEVWITGADNILVQHEFKRFGTRYQLTSFNESPSAN